MPSLLFLISILVLSQAATLVRFADASSLAICFWRLLIAGLLLLPLALKKTRLKAFSSFTRTDFFYLGVSGLCLFAHFYYFFRSVQETTIANSTILFSINPVSTALGAYLFFREKLSLHLALSCALGFAGIFALFGESFLHHRSGLTPATGIWGDLWGVLSALFFSGYILSGKFVRRKLANSTFAAAIYLQTALSSLIVMIAGSVPLTGYTPTTWAAFAALALLPTICGHALFTYCLNHLDINFMSCMTLVEPVLAAAVAKWLFHETLTDWAIVGFALTCVAVLVLYWERLFRSSRVPQPAAGVIDEN